MSRSKLVRALLAAASILGALPLLAQSPAPTTVAASTTGSAFPLGRYLIQPAEGNGNDGAGLTVEFTGSTVKVIRGPDVIETRGMYVVGDVWWIFEFTGECLAEGSYHWHLNDGLLTFEIIADPCAERARSLRVVRLMKQS